MRVFDPLYGQFETPVVIDKLLFSPEVRRLSQIRLLNTFSPSLATLGEIRRYSHTLGVLHLCDNMVRMQCSDRERFAFMAAVLLHDVGTPPFGHLFEYHLREQWRWHHEAMPDLILVGRHAPENRAHQLFGGRSLEFRAIMEKHGIDITIVREILKSKHPMSALLFGSMDLDNLDNVMRMAWALGMEADPRLAVDLARSLDVDADGQLLLNHEMFPLVAEWARARRSVYEALVFDPYTVAAQAVLSQALSLAFQENVLDQDWWDLYDEELIEILRQRSTTKLLLQEYLGHLPSLVFAMQLAGSIKDLGYDDRRAVHEATNRVLSGRFRATRCYAYIFEDRGTFSKEVNFRDPTSGEFWKSGKKSSSTIVYGFVQHGTNIGLKNCRRAAMSFAKEGNLGEDRILRLRLGPKGRIDNFNYSFDFAPEKD